MRVKPY